MRKYILIAVWSLLGLALFSGTVHGEGVYRISTYDEDDGDDYGSLGSKASGYQPLPAWVQELDTEITWQAWAGPKVNDSGDIVFTTKEEFADSLADNEQRRDVYQKTVNGAMENVEYVSDERAQEVVVYGTLVVSVRTDDNGDQVIYFRTKGISDSEVTWTVQDFTKLRYLNLRGINGEAYLTFAAGESDSDTLDVQVQKFVFGSSGTWERDGTVKEVSSTLSGHSFYASVARQGEPVVFENSDTVHLWQDGSRSEIGAGSQPVVSADGSRVFYVSPQDELEAYDVENDTTSHLYFNGRIPASSPDSSARGRYVVFRSSSTDILPSVDNGEAQIFVFDTKARNMACVSVDSAGQEGSTPSFTPSISPNGRLVVFTTKAPNLTANSNDTYQVVSAATPFRRAFTKCNKDTETSFTLPVERVCANPADVRVIVPAPAQSLADTFHGTLYTGDTEYSGEWLDADASITYVPDGGYTGSETLLYQVKDSSGTMYTDTHNLRVRDYSEKIMQRITDSLSNNAPLKQDDRVAISGKGRWVAYTTTSGSGTTLKLTDTRHSLTYDIFSHSNFVSLHPVLSADGSLLVFSVGNTLYQCDLGTGAGQPQDHTEELATITDGSTYAVNKHGNFVVYVDSDGVQLLDRTQDNTVTTITTSGYAPAIAANGNAVAFADGETVQVHYTEANGSFTNGPVKSFDAGTTNLSMLDLSSNGRFMSFKADTEIEVLDWLNTDGPTVFQTLSSNMPALAGVGGYVYTQVSSGSTMQAYRYDPTDGDLTLLSEESDGTNASADSFRGELTADGYKAIFASNADLTDAGDSERDVFSVNLGPRQETEASSLNVATEQILEDGNPAEIRVVPDTDKTITDLNIRISEAPDHGTVEYKFGEDLVWLEYEPTEDDYNGQDSFTVKARDKEGIETEKTITVEVQAVDDAPRWKASADDLSVLAYDSEDTSVDLNSLIEEVDGDPIIWEKMAGSGSLSGSVLDIDAHRAVTTVRVKDDTEAGKTSPEKTFVIAGALEGWNMLSFPIPLLESEKVTVTDATSSPLWYWEDGTYQAVSEDSSSSDYLEGLEAQNGFWLFNSAYDYAYVLPVNPTNDYDATIELTPGWNLVGAGGYGEKCQIPGGLEDVPIWGWDVGKMSYEQPNESLNTLSGYWIYNENDSSQTIELDLGE